MTVDSLLALLLNVAIPACLAVAGGILAARTLSHEKRLEKGLWTALFIVLALIAIGLAFVQQVRFTTQQATNEQASRSREQILNGETKFTQGQLDSINKVLGSLVSKQGQTPETKEVIQALIHASASVAPPNSSSSKHEVPATTPRGAASEPKSAYKELDETYAHVSQINSDWRSEIHVLDAQYHPSIDRYGRPVTQPFSKNHEAWAMKMALLNSDTDKNWQRLEQEVVKAFEGALDRMKAQGPNALSPNDVAGETKQFTAAINQAEKGLVTEDIQGNNLHEDRFALMVDYLAGLRRKLGSYPEATQRP